MSFPSGKISATSPLTAARIEQIADAQVATLEEAFSDAKLAKSYHTACKSHKKQGQKRASDDTHVHVTSPKKPKLQLSKYDLDYSLMTSDQLESTLALPLETDETKVKSTRITTNRAPLVLAFAVELLRFTMPEQPPSSRLSLAQAVVSANSLTKAISLGIEKAGSEIPLSAGQPKVRVMGREIPVLKRTGYTWSGMDTSSTGISSAAPKVAEAPKSWVASQRLTSRSSTFVAHAITVKSATQRAALMRALMAEKPNLTTADHNAWAVRTRVGNSPLVQEASHDDGESGCGKFLLELMRESDIANTLVVLTRWYGGIMLGPDRWRLMRECSNEAMASMRRTASVNGEPLWGLDTQDTKAVVSTVGMAIHRPEAARNYLLRSFLSAPGEGTDAKKTVAAVHEEKQENLGKLLGALRLLFESWQKVLSADEMDKRAWGWYVAVRPDIESGPGGWGAKGTLSLEKILALRRTSPE